MKRKHKMKMKEWLPLWLKEEVKPSVKEWTYIRYSEIVKQHLLPHKHEMMNKLGKLL